MNNLKIMGALAGAFAIGTMILTTQADAAKKVKVTSNVPITATKVTNRNVAITGKNKIYNKAGVLKNAKAVTSAKQLKQLGNSQRSKDFFNVYRMATTNKGQVYYKVVSFEGKWRGWIYGGKTKADYQGGIRSVQTTKDVPLPDDVKNAKFTLGNPGISGTSNSWTAIPWSQYGARLKTTDSRPYANDELRVTAAKQLTRQYYGTFYYVVDDTHPEFNGWLNSSSLKAATTPPTNTTTTVTNYVQSPPEVVTNTVTNTVTKTVEVPAKNPLTVNYNVYELGTSQNQAVSNQILKMYQDQYASVLSELTKNPDTAATKLKDLGDGQTLKSNDPTPMNYASIAVSFDKDKNVITITLNWVQPIIFVSDAQILTGDDYYPKSYLWSVMDGTGVSYQRGDWLDRVQISIDVNTKLPGTYHTTYTFKLMDGMTATATATVTVTK